ncbi:MAG: hypothetical protein LBS93_03485 [Synergistaceae bacterium]|jgi:hypothetical protein|nr:hypothetical protein [Synergistaceae bacterium]
MSEADRFIRRTLVKGFVLGKEKNSTSVNGLFLGVVAGITQFYLKVRFLTADIDRNSSWDDFILVLNGGAEDEPNETLVRYGSSLHDFITLEGILLNEKDALDGKTVERKITYFCSDAMEISAVTFIQLISVSGDEIYSILPFLKEELETSDAADDSEEAMEVPQEVFIPCGAVIDPVSGIPASRLEAGDTVYCRLPDGSPFFGICAASIPNFNGVVTGEVTGVKINEFGSAVVALNLADGVYGALKLSSNIVVKATRHASAPMQIDGITRLVLVSVVCVAILLVAIGILFHFLT